MANLSPLEERYLDKTHETQTALWSALISAEAILLAVAPFLALVAPQSVRSFSALLIALSLLGTGLLVWNFVSTRNQFFKIGQIIGGRRAPSERDSKDADKLRLRVLTRERLAILLLAFQFLLVLGLAIMVAYQ